jgi:hypothetical protein
MTHTSTPPGAAPGTLLARRQKFEQAHPGIRITPPPLSKSGSWEATWADHNGEPAEMVGTDGPAFFRELERLFP